MQIISGWLSGDKVRQVPVRNFNRRPAGEISLIVIHCISLPPGQFGGPYVDRLFSSSLDPADHPYFEDIYRLELSTHLFIRRDGSVTQYVSFLDRAWHAGRSSYLGHKECNDYSVGIELEGTDQGSYTDEQYAVLNEIISLLRKTYPDIKDNIASHSEIAPGRKTDPGSYFSYERIGYADHKAWA